VDHVLSPAHASDRVTDRAAESGGRRIGPLAQQLAPPSPFRGEPWLVRPAADA